MPAATLPAQIPNNQPQADPAKAIVYRIATNDIIRVGVFQEPDLDMISRVDVKGLVNLPLLGQIRVINLTIPEAEEVIESAYQTGRFLRNPQVTITVQEYTPREVSIQGQVRNPGRYPLPIEQSMSLLELVTRAQGFTDTAKGTAVTVTRVNTDGTKEVFTVDVESLIKGRDRAKVKDSSLTLLPGDIVYVPERII
ncbi:MAG: polysaccharide biosynthesis/export family protein [Opitutaceae bacterium]|nr:polysaccharide biosynthesis/export family protein [Opitutaceae bacterium]